MTMFIVQVLGIVQLSMFLDAGLQRLQGSEIISDVSIMVLPSVCSACQRFVRGGCCATLLVWQMPGLKRLLE